MTLYRDDIQETITFSNMSLTKTKGLSEAIIRLNESSLHRLKVLSSELVSVSEIVADKAIYPTKDQIIITDHHQGLKKKLDYIFDELKLSESFKNIAKSRSLIFDQITSSSKNGDKQKIKTHEFLAINDVFRTKQFSMITVNESIILKGYFRNKVNFKNKFQEIVVVSDTHKKLNQLVKQNESISFNEEFHFKKITKTIVKETIKASDKSILKFTSLVTDQINFNEKYQPHLIAKQNIADTVNAVEFSRQLRKVKHSIFEDISISLFSGGKNVAKQSINDLVFVENDESKHTSYGLAWTANVDNWAMSRYQDYGFFDLVAIDGLLYGIADDGIYRLDADTYIQGKLVTGQLDLGQATLVHPTAAVLEYQLSGDNSTLSIAVSTTQSGVKQTYSYNLPKEPANYLTSGRIQFGKGLRGRHFSFEIKIGGLYGYINDFSIDITGTKRRV